VSRGGDTGESVEARLLAIAHRHIRRDGFRRMTVVRIAEEAGMAHANVYRYFPSKAAIGERVVGDWLRGIEQRLNDIAQSPDPASDKLERFLTFLARAYQEKAEGDPQVYAVFADASEAGEALARRHRARMRELLRRVLEEGGSARVFASPDVRRLERITLDGMFRFIDPHAVRRSRRAGSEQSPALEIRRDRLIRVVLAGLALR